MRGQSGKSCLAAHPGTHPPRAFAPCFSPVPGGRSWWSAAPTASLNIPAQTPEILFCPALHTCSTCSKTRSRFPRRTPWSSSSLQPRLSNSSISTGYVDTSSSPWGNLCGHRATRCWAPDLFSGPDSQPQPYVSRVHGTPAMVR